MHSEGSISNWMTRSQRKQVEYPLGRSKDSLGTGYPESGLGFRHLHAGLNSEAFPLCIIQYSSVSNASSNVLVK